VTTTQFVPTLTVLTAVHANKDLLEMAAQSVKISMSVLRIQVRVMKMQIARTMKVLTAALVNRDLLEMERFVKN